jgi:DMSO/TMAO reductase YedYZ molybdopterin-dependent catalytic subunit
MQLLKQNKIIALILMLIIIILTITVAFSVQNLPKPLPTPTPTPTPTSTNTASASPAENSPTPSIKITPTPTPIYTSQPSQTVSLFPGEVAQYQNQTLTPISFYIDYLLQHPDVAIAGTQNIDKATYHLAITGLVNNTVNYTYDEVINNFNSTLQVATLPCVEGWSVRMLWQGIPITDLLQQAGVGSNATTLIFLASDGYSTSLPLDYIKQNNITIAYKMNNVTLTAQTGWPFFLVAQNQYGYKWIEWITEINVSNNSNYLGYWESRGYPNDATVVFPNSMAQSLINVQVFVPVMAVSIAAITVAAAVIYRGKTKKQRK